MYHVLIIGCGITGARPGESRFAGGPSPCICSGEMNSPGIEVLALCAVIAGQCAHYRGNPLFGAKRS